MQKQSFSKTLKVEVAGTIIDLLFKNSQLSKQRIKDALVKGSVQLKRKGFKQRRIRKAKFQVKPGDEILFSYSDQILTIKAPIPHLIHEMEQYSIWYKPAGLLTQGTPFGDHCSLQRYVEVFYNNKKEIKLIHRLDRDACGIVILAHQKSTAAAFSKLFQQQAIIKKYYAVSIGVIGKRGHFINLNYKISGKNASTTVTVSDVHDNCSELDIILHTGRKHQIRKHLSKAGYPLMGDKLYGNQSPEGPLMLVAYQVTFPCPISLQQKIVRLPEKLFLSLKMR